MTMLDTPEAIDWFRIKTVIRALKMEVEHGMQLTRIPVLPVCRQYGFSGRTKKEALVFMENLLKERESK